MIWIEYRSLLTGSRVVLDYPDIAIARRAMNYLGIRDFRVVQDSEHPERPPVKERDLPPEGQK